MTRSATSDFAGGPHADRAQALAVSFSPDAQGVGSSPMPWVEVFAVLVVSHLVGDYLLQTEWQALNKRGGLTGTATMRRALISHIATYTLAFVPALIWLAGNVGEAFGLTALIAAPHLVQDDGTLLAAYARAIKKTDLRANPQLEALLDQSFHVLALFGTALLVGS
jgi:hypothetical protein